MKSLGKLKLKDAHQLSNDEMKQLEGGISQGEYCRQLSSQWSYARSNNWSSGAYEGWWSGWSTYCK